MAVYVMLPLSIVYFIIISQIIINNNNLGETSVVRSKILLMSYFIIFFALAAFKGINVGTDYPMYYGFYLNNSYEGIVEPGIGFIYFLSIIYNNFLIFSFCVYFLSIIFIFKGIRDNCPNYLIGILMFLLTYCYFTAYNQLRQAIAVSLIFGFISYLISRKKIDKLKFAAIILIAILFHNSAVFLFLLFLIPRERINPTIVIFLFLLTIVLYFVPEFKSQMGIIITKISGVYLNKYQGDLSNFFDVNKEKGFVQLLPVIFQMIIVTISLFFPKKNPNLSISYTLYNYSTNLVVIGLCLYSLSGIEAVDRLQIYFSTFNIYFYSLLIHQLLNLKSKFVGKLFVSIIIIFWLLYYSLRLINNISGVVPYYLINF